MAKVKNFKTIFPAVSVPLNDDYSINEAEFRTYLRWIKSFYLTSWILCRMTCIPIVTSITMRCFAMIYIVL